MPETPEAHVERRLRSALAELGLSTDLSLDQLLAAYQGADRFYHNLGHIADCLTVAGKLGNTSPRIILALCYHDAVYDSKAKDNEEQSAAWARRDLESLGAPADLISDVGRLILATAHRLTPQAPDEAVIVDVDLSILGRSPEEYDRYVAAVRREYGWVSDEDWRKGRGQFLRNLLDRPNIFFTKEMQVQFELATRSNLERELGGLAG